MSAHPSAHHEIARLRHEERLVRAALVNAHPHLVGGVHDRRRLGGFERLLGAVQTHLGTRQRAAAIRVPRLLS